MKQILATLPLLFTGLALAQGDRLDTWIPVPLADGVRAAVPCEDGTVRLFELATGKTDVVLSGHLGRVRAVLSAPDGATLASCGEDQTIRLWDLVDGSCLATLETP